ncbi:MAG: PilZ domain-containing protein, partial [Myxococcaceae bacterium]|nr:PilZ domain-containing protein [Myxococcaceae bacterium]
MAGENQRRTPRVAASQVVVKVSTKDRFRSSYLRDLSEGGLFVKTDAPLPVGREIVIDLLPPTWTEPLRLKGVVTRQELTGTNKGMGVQFKDNDAAAVERLAGLISDYQTGTLPPPEAPVDHKVQAEQLLEQLAAARTALEHKSAELDAERARREEQEQRALQLAQELGAARANESAAPAGHAQLDEMVAELAAAHHEVSELRTRVGELEGELAAYQQEVQVLEQDDATTRQLAGTLAKEKTELTAEVQRLRAAVDAEKGRAKDAIRAAEEAEKAKARELVRAAEESGRAAAAVATARASAAESELEAMRLALAEAQGRVQAFEENAVQVQAHLDATAAQLAEAKAASQASAQRLKQLEASLKDEKAKAEKARTKEREVRELLAAMSSG